MHLTEEDENNIQTINEFKVTWFTLLSRVDAAPTVDEIVLTSLNHVANLIICRKCGDQSKSVVFDMALSLCVFETLFQWNFVFSGADLEAYKVRELQFYDSLIGYNGELYLSHEAFVIPFMATIHHCSLRSCLLVERALVRLLNTVCAILSAQFKHDSVQNDDNTNPLPSLINNKLDDALLLFRRMCMGVVDLNQISTGLTSDLNHDTINNNDNSINANLERCSSLGGGLMSSLKIMESIDWAMCLESSKLDMDNGFHNNDNVFLSDFDESPSYNHRNNNNNNKLPTIDSICDLLAPFIFRDGDLGWQARDSLLLIGAYSLRDEEFSHNIAKYSSICAVIATGLGMLYTALPHRLVNNNSPETWPVLIRTLNTNQLANTRFNEFLGALDFCRSLLEIAHPLIQSCLLHCIHAVFFVSIIGPALTQKAPEDVITATVYLEQFIIHTVDSSLLPILLRFLLMKLPSTIVFDADSQGNQLSTATTAAEITSHTGYRESSSSPYEIVSTDGTNSSVFLSGFNNNNNNNDNLDGNQHQFIASSSITYMDLIIARIHQCNSLLGITTLSLMNTIIDLHCEDIMFVLVLKHLIVVRDNLFSIGWTWPDPSHVNETATKLLNLSSMNLNRNSTRFDMVTNEKITHHNSYHHQHQDQHRRQRQTYHSSNNIAQLDIDNAEEFSNSDLSNSHESHTNDGLEALASRNEPVMLKLDSLPVGSQFLASHLLIPHMELTTNSLIFNNHYRNDIQLTNRQDCTKQVSFSNSINANGFLDYVQQTPLHEISSSCSSPISPTPSMSSTISNSNDPKTSSSQMLINSSNSMLLDWLSYTSWAHQTIKIRKHACKTWQLTFDANQPTIEQVNLLNENLKKLQMTEKDFTTRYQKLRKFSECDCRIGLDPYKIYREYKCFISKNCCTNLDVEMTVNELHAKALCNAATKLNIDTDLDLDGSENLDECPLAVNENDPHSHVLQQKQTNHFQKFSSNEQIDKSSMYVRNSLGTSNSADEKLCTSFKQSKKPLEHSMESFINMKLYDKSLIKSWYCLNFLDSCDINEQFNANNNTFTNIVDTTTINQESSVFALPDETNPESLVDHSECTKQTLHNSQKAYKTMEGVINTHKDYCETECGELNKFIQELENFSCEKFNVLDEEHGVKTSEMCSKHANNVIRCGSLSCLSDHVDESCQYFDELYNQLKANSLQTLPNQVTNHHQQLFSVPLIRTCEAYSMGSLTKDCSESHLKESINKICKTPECLTENNLNANGHQRHHHQHHDNYCEMRFNHGSLNNLIQTSLVNDRSSSNNDCNSPYSPVLMSSTDTKEQVKEAINADDLSNHKQQQQHHQYSSPSRSAASCTNNRKKRLSTSTISSTTSCTYLETLQHSSQNNTCDDKPLEYDRIDSNLNNVSTNTTTDNEDPLNSCATYPNLGPFLTTLLNRLENFTNNCFYANLYLTNLISSLASYPIPLLRAILFLTNTTELTQSIVTMTTTNSQCNNNDTKIIRALHDDVLYYAPYNLLCLIKEQIELFTVLYTRQVKYYGLLDTLNGYSFSELKQEARRYLNCETIDLSKLSSASVEASTTAVGVDINKKNESKVFTPTDKQNIPSMMNSNKQSYFRKWFSLSSSKSSNNNKNSHLTHVTGSNHKHNKNRKSSSTSVLNPKDLLDFSQILQKPMTEFTCFIDLHSSNQQLMDSLAEQNTSSSSNNNNKTQHRRRSFRLSTIRRLKSNVNTDGRMMMNTENSMLDVPRIQRMVLCAVIFEDFCKELAAICTEHSIQW
ncbi:FTS and Hook-interacting protein isoform 1 [Schistosoma japonicum]|uniref:FTS and Hook-interacting protein isoform 1 n=2 Tax=Schistosoma japonicum TaxID=6182 RepID=A0A4Z2CUH2_SCHJA|nr:FTS and Hook-interacting protein isoform 1 [Schistosoma japonicum]